MVIMALEIIFKIVIIAMILTGIIEAIIRVYIKHSKKYKDIKAVRNPIIEIISNIVGISSRLLIIGVVVLFLWTMFSHIFENWPELSETTKTSTILYIIIALLITCLGLIIEGIYYIFSIIKIIKDNK